MKFTKLLIFVLLLISQNCLNAQWQPDVRMTNDPAVSNTSRNNAWCIASTPFIQCVVWQDERDGSNGEIYYKRSTNGGASWGADTRLTNNSAGSGFPSVTSSGAAGMSDPSDPAVKYPP